MKIRAERLFLSAFYFAFGDYRTLFGKIIRNLPKFDLLREIKNKC